MPPNTLPLRLQDTLRHEIPLTQALGLEVQELAEGRLVLRAPLGPSLNHKCTAFGGSLYSVAVLAGWGWIWAALQERGLPGTIVIQHSRMEYASAVDGDLVARCQGPGAARLDRFLRTYQRRGRARLDLEVHMDGAGERPAASFSGSYVVLREAAPPRPEDPGCEDDDARLAGGAEPDPSR